MAGALFAIAAGIFSLGWAFYFGIHPKGRQIAPRLHVLYSPWWMFACGVLFLVGGIGGLRMVRQEQHREQLRQERGFQEHLSSKLGGALYFLSGDCEETAASLPAVLSSKGYEIIAPTRAQGSLELSLRNPQTMMPGSQFRFLIDLYQARDWSWEERAVLRAFGGAFADDEVGAASSLGSAIEERHYAQQGSYTVVDRLFQDLRQASDRVMERAAGEGLFRISCQPLPE